MPLAIRAENISKKFIIAHEEREQYVALRDVISRKARKFISFSGKQQNTEKTGKEEFWALRDISFDIEQGERVGIVGRNGAGKSTLLKILSRITEPSGGIIRIKGRVASLLEVGTGFHPELTGRENIFLNGAICGMNRQEIRKKFDEIVAFAEIERFLDTPVKRYSSGMYVRLAFAVAAHLEPEILIIDEVLAVGDAQFQKKCLGKIEDVNVNEGRTVLFVSHDLSAIERLCNRALLLKSGQLEADGPVAEVIGLYYDGLQASSGAIDFLPGVRLEEFVFGAQVLEEGSDLPFSIAVSFDKKGFNSISDLAVLLYDHKGIRVAVVDLRYELRGFSPDSSRFSISGKLKNLNLVQGVYNLGLYAGVNNKYQNLFNLAQIEVKPRIEGYTHKTYEPQYLGYIRIGYEIDSKSF